MALEIRRQEKALQGHKKKKNRIRVDTHVYLTSILKFKHKVIRDKKKHNLREEMYKLMRPPSKTITDYHEMIDSICSHKMPGDKMIRTNTPLDRIRKNNLPSP
jgi:hypothetical protein